jgi:hypothetical protein
MKPPGLDMDYLQILRMWVQLERRTAAVRQVRDHSGTTLSVTSTGSDTLALTWRCNDPLAVRVNVLAGCELTSAVVSREALRDAARVGFRRTCWLVAGDRVLRPARSQVRRLLDATDAIVPTRREPVVIEAAASRFLHTVLGPVAPLS